MAAFPHPPHALSIRPLSEEDLPAIVALNNRDRPSVHRYTVADWLRREAGRTGDELTLRLVAGDPPVAYLEMEDRSTSVERQNGVCEGELIVAPEYRRQGIGSALLERAEAFACERDAHTLRAWFYQYGADDSGARFLEHRGFAEYQRRQTLHLDLAGFDAARFAHAVADVERQDVRILSYADLTDTDAHRRRLFALFAAFYHYSSFEDWCSTYLSQRDWSTDVVMVAEADGNWAALHTFTLFNSETGAVYVSFTGTLPAYRGRGLATALKVRGAEILQRRGGRIILTSNRVENAPILAINRALGFIPGPIELTYAKEWRRAAD